MGNLGEAGRSCSFHRRASLHLDASTASLKAEPRPPRRDLPGGRPSRAGPGCLAAGARHLRLPSQERRCLRVRALLARTDGQPPRTSQPGESRPRSPAKRNSGLPASVTACKRPSSPPNGVGHHGLALLRRTNLRLTPDLVMPSATWCSLSRMRALRSPSSVNAVTVSRAAAGLRGLRIKAFIQGGPRPLIVPNVSRTRLSARMPWAG